MTFSEGADHRDRTLKADICIIGGGPAGVGVASGLAASGSSVVVLESGGRYLDRLERSSIRHAVADHATGAQSATRGRNRGHAYYPLRLSRARGVGGSTAALRGHGLRSRPLDAIDFSPVHGPRWPISHEEYARFLPPAMDLCGLSPAVERSLSATGLGASSGMAPVPFSHGPREAIARAASLLADREGHRWILDATVTGVHVDAEDSVTHVTASTSTGDRFRVEADRVVLAAGGIDTARVVLANPDLLAALGPAAEFVGRGFMEHLHYPAGVLVPVDARAYARICEDFCDIDEELWITPDDATVRRERLARSAFVPIPASASSLHAGVRAFGRVLRSIPHGPFDRRSWSRDMGDIWHDRRAVAAALAERVRASAAETVFILGAMSEQIPNEASRVELSTRTDRFGLPLADLRWIVSEEDRRSARRSAELVGSAFEEAELATFETMWDDDHPPAFQGGWHHLGTTRMSVGPAEGVVDPEGRMHGVDNLYVAGSSVFPSGGFANPTLSLVALSVRLGHHLAGGTP